MKKKLVPAHKPAKIPSIKTYNDGLASSKSTSVLSTLLLKSDNKSSTKQRRHFPANPEILFRYESMRTLNLTGHAVSKSKYRKITEDFDDHINFEEMGDNQKGRSSSQSPGGKFLTGKKMFASTNLFI